MKFAHQYLFLWSLLTSEYPHTVKVVLVSAVLSVLSSYIYNAYGVLVRFLFLLKEVMDNSALNII